MSEITSAEDFAAAMAQADEPEQPPVEASEPAESTAPVEEGQPEGDEPAVEPVEGEEGEPAQEEQPDEPASSDDRVVKWQTASGEAFEVTERELRDGYMRQSDYTQKAQAVAEERKQAQTQLQQQAQEVHQLAAEYGQLHNVRTELKQYEGVNWQQLQVTDPEAYQQHVTRVLLLQNQERQAIDGLNVKRQQMAQQAQQAAQVDWREANEKAMKLLSESIKGFDTDSGVRSKAIAQMTKAGQDFGFSAEELGQVQDGRMLRVLWEASQWRDLQAKKPAAQQKVQAAPTKVTKPAANVAPPTAIEKARQQLKTRKDPASFAALLAKL